VAQSQSVEGESTPGSFESWLRNIGLEHYAAVFQQNEIDFDVCRTLSDSIDMEYCANCGGRLKIIAAIVDPAVITTILTHLHLPARAPPRSAARRADLFQAA
jgi:hypothetical protein